MKILNEQYNLDVDINVTTDYYKSNSLCECSDCQKYYSLSKDKFPLLDRFLSSLGVDISRPDELSADSNENGTDYHFASYTVAGAILSAEKYEIGFLDNGMQINIIIDKTSVPNTLESEEFFTVTVYGIHLP